MINTAEIGLTTVDRSHNTFKNSSAVLSAETTPFGGNTLSSHEDSKQESDPVSELQQLRANYDSLLQERNRIVNELSSLGEALAECQRNRVELESSLRRLKDVELNPSFGEATNTRLRFLEQETESLSRMSDQLESLLFRSIANEPGIKEKAREFIMSQGSMTHRVLLLVTERGSMDGNELVRLTGLDQMTINRAIEILLRERALEIHGSLLTVPGALKLPDVEEWRRIPLDKLFDEVEHYCTTVKTPELVSQALQALKDGVEQKVRIRGTLVFEIGKEVQQWKRGIGNIQDLRFKINEWKQRARQ
jgi:hypothetical protein